MIKEYSENNRPKILYGFNSKTTKELVTIIKQGKLSSDSENVILYILNYERNFNENQIIKLKKKLIRNSENQIFEDFGTIVQEKENSLFIKFKKQNKYLIISLIVFLSASYIFLILPFLINNFNDRMYLFGMLILLFPIIIIKMILRLKDEKSFNLEVNKNFIKIKSLSTNYKEVQINKPDIKNIGILEKDFEMKIFINRYGNDQIEIMTEDFNRIDKNNVYEYMNLIKEKINRNLNYEITYS